VRLELIKIKYFEYLSIYFLFMVMLVDIKTNVSYIYFGGGYFLNKIEI
jgi:hypothetical protein